FQALNQEQLTLKAEADQVNVGVASLNNLSDKINALADALNRLAAELNLKVGTYNNVGSAAGRSFIEGDYEQNGSNQAIDIYEFGSEAQLVRVLTHEFGHALGLNHVSDPKAVMYKYNEGTNDKLTAADLGELRRVCGIIQ
ncbi:MAG TPA: matrixin family metalloprotease, partial [Candidatus Tyrphobacter sp.]|nr:matrixin family metalloprotease [Candidatus Tyrphobacter sp.]